MTKKYRQWTQNQPLCQVLWDRSVSSTTNNSDIINVVRVKSKIIFVESSFAETISFSLIN